MCQPHYIQLALRSWGGRWTSAGLLDGRMGLWFRALTVGKRSEA